MLGWPAGNTTLLQYEVFQSAPGEVRMITLQRRICLLVVSVTQGGLDVWLGAYQGNLPGTPHLHFGQTNAPVWVPIPETMTDLTIKSIGPANPVHACLIVGGPRE